MPLSKSNFRSDSSNTVNASSSSACSEDAVVRPLSGDDPFLAELANGVPICFAGIPYAKEAERQQNFLNSAQIGRRLHIAIPSNGLNLHLDINYVQLVPERNEVHFVSNFLFNDVRVHLRGHIGIRTLHGKAKIELLQNEEESKMSERKEQRIVQLRAAALRL